MNYGGKFPEDVRTRTMDKIMNILAYTDLDITSDEKVENEESL
jgi:hypothetical protein